MKNLTPEQIFKNKSFNYQLEAHGIKTIKDSENYRNIKLEYNGKIIQRPTGTPKNVIKEIKDNFDINLTEIPKN